MTAPSQAQATSVKRVTGLRANALAAIMMLLVEYALGVLTGLYGGRVPSGRGASTFPAFWASITDGPVLLAVHAAVGSLLIVTAATAAIRASMLRRPAALALTVAALGCIIAAWIAGSNLVAGYTPGALLTMALGDAAAIGCYTVALFRKADTNPAPTLESIRRDPA